MLSFSALQVAQMLGGELKGNPSQIINDIGKIESAQSNQITFFANPKYENYLYESNFGKQILCS
jgi:UDP-3-O-[3-hydroxymyristoyl] glucosamine N-acyltransferase